MNQVHSHFLDTNNNSWKEMMACPKKNILTLILWTHGTRKRKSEESRPPILWGFCFLHCWPKTTLSGCIMKFFSPLWPEKFNLSYLEGFFGQKWRKQTPPKMANGGLTFLHFRKNAYLLSWSQVKFKTTMQGVKARTLGRQNERNFCYDRLALTSKFVCVSCESA